MRFLVRLANKSQASPTEIKQLTAIAYEAVRNFGADIGNLRVSNTAVELDLLLSVETVLKDSLKALEAKLGPVLTLRKLDVVGPPMEKAEAIRMGLELFNEERYWESHEALEYAWRESSGEEKEFLQGLILVAAALVHWQKNEKEVTLSVMRRALDKLAAISDGYSGIDIVALRRKVSDIVAAGQPEFFRIKSK